MSKKLTKEEVKALKENFDEIDTNKDGQMKGNDRFLSKRLTISAYFQKILGWDDVKTFVDDIFDKMDYNKDGKIDFNEFIKGHE